jgi:hypothetical protein
VNTFQSICGEISRTLKAKKEGGKEKDKFKIVKGYGSPSAFTW